MNGILKRLTCLILTLCLLSTIMLPGPAFADETTEPVSALLESEVSETGSSETEPEQSEYAETEQAEPVETEPDEVSPVETEAVETEPVEPEPVETEAVEPEPVETEPVEPAPVETESAQPEPAETDPVESEPVETEPVETDPVVTEPEPVPEQPSDGPTTETEITVVSRTENIVGDVFARMFTQDEAEQKTLKKELAEYPREHHELSYYKDSSRVRYLKGGEGEDRNYLVYRDSYLLISEEDSLLYKVDVSEDGTSATVSPAVFPERLDNKTGIVFLGENIGCDEILVFGGETDYHGDAVTFSLKPVEEIVVTELFSDGKLEFNGDSGEPKRIDFGFTIYPKGTNWQGEITSFKPYWPKARVHVDLWDLEFQLILNLKFDMGFEIETTGSSGGRQSAKIASVSVPVELFDIGVQYNLQVEFPNAPMKFKGTSTTEMEITMDLLFGTRISKFENPISLTDLTVKNPADYNKDIPFYIGSQILIYGGFLEISVDLWLFSIDFGPVLSINIDNSAGCYGIARYEKNTFSEEDIGQKNRLHTCTAQGEAGCLTVNLREVSKFWIYFKIDIYVDHWELPLYSPGEVPISEYSYYNSYTHHSGMQKGVCPHLFYMVPVRVWLDDNMTRPAANMAVTVSDSLQISPAEERFVSSVTDSNGSTFLYLPYIERYQYTFVSNGVIDGRTLAGSKKQTVYIQAGDNPVVNIVLRSDEIINIKTDIVWEADFEKKDVPSGSYAYLNILLFRRRAGSDDEWEWTDYYDAADSSEGWRVDQWTVPKFGFDSSGAFLYEYRVRLLEENDYGYDYSVITPEDDNCFILRGIEAYTDVAGNTVQSHANKYQISYDEKTTDETLETTIRATAVMDIRLSKSWKLQDSANKAEFVYLALLQKPADGWENKAVEKHVPQDWVVILDPILGPYESIRSLLDADQLTVYDDLSSVENRPLAIGKVNNDNQWTLNYTVCKYRNGIRLQYEGCELDNTVMENLLKHEYDIRTSVLVKSFGNYLSIPGTTTEEDYYSLNAVVVNTDPIADNTLSGTIYWQDSYYTHPTDYVVLHFRKNGEPLTDLTVYKSESALEENLWFWQLTLDDYDPDAEYTVTETIPFGPDGPEYVGVPYGLNLINYLIVYDYVQAEAQVIFDVEPAGLDQISIGAYDYWTHNAGWEFTVEKRDGWWARNADKKKTEVAPIEDYIVEAPNLHNYVTVRANPYAYTRPGWGNLFYNFTVYYLFACDNLKLHISKEWEDDGSAMYPESVVVEVFRDDEKIAETTLTRNGSNWSTAVISEDLNHNNLTRTYYDTTNYTHHKHVYTIREKPVEGFTSKATVTADTGTDIYYTLTNTWVGADCMNVAGTVTWEGDEGKEYLRPENVQISVIDSNEEFVKSVTVPVSGNGKFEAKYLPGKDAEGHPLTYSVMESHVDGYTAVYSTPTFDEETRTWTCDVTNKLTGYCPITVKKTVEGKPEKEDKDGDGEEEEETYKFTVEPKNGLQTVDHEFPAPRESELSIQGAGETKAEFILDQDGLYAYTFKEVKGETENCVYDKEVKLVLILRTTDPEGNVNFKSWVGVDGEEGFTPSDDNKSDTVEFVNRFPSITIEKKWDIDLEKNDKPDSIEAVVQKKNGDNWENVKLVELKDDNDWKVTVNLPIGKDDEYRVRELKEETALQEIIRTLKETITQFSTDQYDSWIGKVKESLGDYYNMLPDFIREAADQGADKLKEALKAKEEDLLDKLLEQIGLATAMDRIVYDEDDSDKPDGDDVKTNMVTFHVGEKNSVVTAGKVDAHVTEYKVSYSKDDNTYTIENMAVLEIDVIKRWISIGDDGITIVGVNDGDDDDDDDDDMPDSAWIVLLFKPSADIGENSAAQSIASSAGVSLDDVLNYEFPVINPEEGGKDPISIISKLTIGVDLDIFSNVSFIPKLAIDRVDEDCNWTKTYVVSKYYYGIPMEYKGAELGSEIIRQIVKYLTGIDFFISYNPFENYFSIPTKAIRTIAGITDPGDFLDLSKLGGALLNKAKSLTMDDLRNFGPSTILDDWHLMANVINIKINFDLDSDNDLSGTKIWKNDTEENRPEWIKIHVKDGQEEIEGSPITLNKSDFEGKDEWSWELELPEDSDIDPDDCTVSEEYPEDYQYKDSYTAEFNGLDIINTWNAMTVRVSGKKIWKDDNNAAGLRPDFVTIKLLADGEEIASVKTSKQGEWRFVFAEQPKYKTETDEETGETRKVEINYSVVEDEVEGYTASYEGYNVINSNSGKGMLVVKATRSEDEKEKEQAFVYRIQDENGSELLAVAVILEAGQTENSVRISLPTGMYQITEESLWSWRWEGSLASAIMQATQSGNSTANARFGDQIRIAEGWETVVTYSYDLEIPDWLNSCAHRQEDTAPPPNHKTDPEDANPDDEHNTNPDD